MEKTNHGLIYLILGTISMILGYSAIVVFIITKNWKEPPGMLVLWHLFSQSLIDTTISIIGISIVFGDDIMNNYCDEIGALNLYFYGLAFNYIVCLCTEVLLKLHRPMENAYPKRSKFYHFISHTLSLSISIYVYIGQDTGITENYFCFVKYRTSIIYILTFPLLLFLPFLITTYCVIYKMVITTPYVNYFVKKHLLYITANFIIWTPIILDILVWRGQEISHIISSILISSSGTILTLLRILSLLYVNYIKKSQNSSTVNISIVGMINDTLKENPEMPLLKEDHVMKSDYVYVFASMSTESALTAIIIFNYSSLYHESFNFSEEKQPPWDDHFYTEQKVIKIDERNLELMVLPRSLKAHYRSLTLEYTVYSREIFKNIMDIEEITSQDLLNSFNLLSILSNFTSMFRSSGGRSGSFFLYSTDRKYILKTISRKELKVLLSDFLKAYHVHLYKYHDSVICRILGAYSFKVNSNYEIHFIVMQSVYTESNLKAIYDLKGSKVDRNVRIGPDAKDEYDNIVFKDLNFLSEEKNLKMPFSVAQRMRDVIENDAKLFPRFNIMDYSLLVAVKNKQEYSKYFFKGTGSQGYSIGIIDFLQRYNKTKQIEGFSKKILKQSMQISCINSEDYFKRFLKFVNEIILEIN